jgi:hypothetical protein
MDAPDCRDPSDETAMPQGERRRTLLQGLGALLATASFPGTLRAQPESARVRLAVGGKATLYYLPLTLTERLGHFRDEGLEVEISDFPGGGKALQSLIGGSADVVSGAYEHTITMQTLAQKVQAFVLQGTNPGLELAVVRARAAAYSWPKDLKGMRIGVSAPGSSTHMFVKHLLASVGLTPDDVSDVLATRGGRDGTVFGVLPEPLLFNPATGKGTVAHVLSSVEKWGRMGIQFFGANPSALADLHRRTDNAFNAATVLMPRKPAPQSQWPALTGQ